MNKKGLRIYITSLIIFLFSGCASVDGYIEKKEINKAVEFTTKQKGEDQKISYSKIADYYFDNENYNEAEKYYEKGDDPEQKEISKLFNKLESLLKKYKVINDLIIKHPATQYLNNYNIAMKRSSLLLSTNIRMASYNIKRATAWMKMYHGISSIEKNKLGLLKQKANSMGYSITAVYRKIPGDMKKITKKMFNKYGLAGNFKF